MSSVECFCLEVVVKIVWKQDLLAVVRLVEPQQVRWPVGIEHRSSTYIVVPLVRAVWFVRVQHGDKLVPGVCGTGT